MLRPAPYWSRPPPDRSAPPRRAHGSRSQSALSVPSETRNRSREAFRALYLITSTYIFISPFITLQYINAHSHTAPCNALKHFAAETSARRCCIFAPLLSSRLFTQQRFTAFAARYFRPGSALLSFLRFSPQRPSSKNGSPSRDHKQAPAHRGTL